MFIGPALRTFDFDLAYHRKWGLNYASFFGERGKGAPSYPVIETTRLENPNPFYMWLDSVFAFVYLMDILDDSIDCLQYLHCRCVLSCESNYFLSPLYRADIQLQSVASAICLYLSIVMRDLIYSCASNCISIGRGEREPVRVATQKVATLCERSKELKVIGKVAKKQVKLAKKKSKQIEAL